MKIFCMMQGFGWQIARERVGDRPVPRLFEKTNNELRLISSLTIGGFPMNPTYKKSGCIRRNEHVVQCVINVVSAVLSSHTYMCEMRALWVSKYNVFTVYLVWGSWVAVLVDVPRVKERRIAC